MYHLYNTIEAVAIFLIVLSYIPKHEPEPLDITCHVNGCVCFKFETQINK